ncbi:hypothetical protein [Corynebacterium mustelae]|nr:hypothetical protein [Corynebacterium mustelae]
MEFEQLGLIHHNPQLRTAKEHDGLLNEIRGNQSLVITAPRSRTLSLMRVREFRELPAKDRRFVFFFADGSPACAVEVEDVAVSKLGSCESLFVGQVRWGRVMKSGGRTLLSRSWGFQRG